jgi:hypothetical protein
MGLIDNIIQTCPYCGLRGSLKQFLGWEHEQKRGYLGRTPEGVILLLCPKCENRIQFYIQQNRFAKECVARKLSRNRCMPILLSILCLVAVAWVTVEVQGGWKYLVGGLLLAYIGTLLRGVFCCENSQGNETAPHEAVFKRSTNNLGL